VEQNLNVIVAHGANPDPSAFELSRMESGTSSSFRRQDHIGEVGEAGVSIRLIHSVLPAQKLRFEGYDLTSGRYADDVNSTAEIVKLERV